jgi:hypothetical protein
MMAKGAARSLKVMANDGRVGRLWESVSGNNKENR